MMFLEAKKLLATLRDAEKIPFMMCMSGTSDLLEFYLRAHAAKKGVEAKINTLTFGTMAQHLFTESTSLEIFLLLPWDLAPECDWRSGISKSKVDLNTILARADDIIAKFANRKLARLAYLPAPIPPVYAAWDDNVRLNTELTNLALKQGATLLSKDFFSLTAYLSNGSPLDGTSVSTVASILIDLLLTPSSENFKLVATDADNTLWAGIVGEDGVNGVSAEPQDCSFKHFIYQMFLLRLKSAGILLALVSRNDEDLVRAVLDKESMPLANEDFVAVCSGYGAKSGYIRDLASDLNLSTDSIVFIDDNLVELAEVSSSIPEITCQAFPKKEEDLPVFLDKLAKLFDRKTVTDEDMKRTEMYNRRAQTLSQQKNKGNGLESFLKDLDMILTVHNRTNGDWKRAHQLINKTNQFNMNGRRIDEAEINNILNEGGQIFTASLEDRTGSHGEILACLIDRTGRVHSFVMSCRVFQRRVENTFLLWLLNYWNGPPLLFVFSPTTRNEPFRNFISNRAFSNVGDCWTIDPIVFSSIHADDALLFKVNENIS